MKIYFVFTLLLIPKLLLAQNATISGYVSNNDSGENLIGATVYELSNSRGTVSNTFGFYSLTSPIDTIEVTYSYVGYEPQTLRFFLSRDTLLTVNLTSTRVLDEVIIKADKLSHVPDATNMSIVNLPINMIKAVPAFMGETDVLKAIQLLPGVQSGTEGMTGLIVRGGSPDQNLILMDGVPIYNATHVYGFFSAFNADAINNVELIKGGFPARYGGRLSSVIDITMKEGNQKKISAQASIGLISSRFLIEGPLLKDRTSFIITGRRSYINLLKSPIFGKLGNGLTDGYYFYDLNAKINHKINANNRIYFSAYRGKDKAASHTSDVRIDSVRLESSESNETASIEWGNTLASLRWNHNVNNKLFFNASLSYSFYNLNIFNERKELSTNWATGKSMDTFYKYNYVSGIRDIATRIDFDFIPSTRHYIKFGGNFTSHYFKPGVGASLSFNNPTQLEPTIQNIYASESVGYVEDDIELTKQLKVNAGLHGVVFSTGGKNYFSLQPRLALRQMLLPDLSLKASFASMRQFIHLLTNAGLGLPTDLWVPSTNRIAPQNSYQVGLGLAKDFNNHFEVTLEGYYKTMNNLIEYKEGSSYLNTDTAWQDKVEVGRGVSYGAELLVQKKMGHFTGWLGYTISKNNRHFDALNNGQWFPYRFDRRHDVKVTSGYRLNKHFNFSATWVYGTGNAVTIPTDQYHGVLSYLGSFEYNTSFYNVNFRNNYRMRDYHRLDASATYTFATSKIEHQFTVGAYNAYNRENPFYLRFANGPEGTVVLKQVSLFPRMPFVSYSFKF